MHANTNDKEQNFLTELIPKINRKYGSIHANMANDMRFKHGRNNNK